MRTSVRNIVGAATIAAAWVPRTASSVMCVNGSSRTLAVAASRAFYWMAGHDRALATRFARAAYAAAWQEERDISRGDTVADIAAAAGADRDDALDALLDPAVKEALRVEVDAAIARGIFGSPFVVVDGEGFWGADRLWQVEAWLERGGW